MAKPLHDNVCNESVYKRLYNTLSVEIHDFLYYKYGANGNPADKTQEAFIKLWENCAKVNPQRARAFLYQVARNLTLNDLKHQQVVLKHQSHNSAKGIDTQDPESVLRQKEYYLKYQQVLASLSEEQRLAFTLSKIEGKKHEEIAQLLGVTKKVVEYRIYSAFAILKKELENFKTK